ncbi:hypothetical protein GUITHDRAFT_99998 [Guillardia theta CCMP2712]|uniref:Uncharacterized protein n=1 Tax=Guillardia theta (strain CCMP2712) TaxID=905079 RepID=L1K102_GUITC|nr:hypothetical protein GUITHDRAFT_99998 [Guillardia theta CCMP2712]EKX54521.1 hypothetical protein GUITHDRAFT_99998 [Guillardia theta CCMP2712]|eukprot:XP_005841501.1 hypothetical protein GUITHDRAFT_99998 [Guillardia theta CCMP2712]
MFWRLGFAHVSPIDTLLEREDITLEELLREEDLVQECKQFNNKLIEFISTPERIEVLINYVVQDAEEGSDENVKYLYPYKASEVLSSDVAPIYDCMFENEHLLNLLFQFLERDPPLDPLLAGYFGKIVSTFVSRRPYETLTILGQRNILPLLLKHINAFSILELLLKIIAEAEDSVDTNLDWLYNQDLIGQLISKLDPSYDTEVHANVAAALTGFISQQQHISWSTSLSGNRFVASLLSEQSVKKLVDKMLNGSASTLDHGLSVLVEMILRNPPHMAPIINSSGTLDPPLGSFRLKILEMIYALVQLKEEEINMKLVSLNVISSCLDLFLKYEWHNFLHNLVRRILETIIISNHDKIKQSLFEDSKILDRIMEAHVKNDEALKQPKSTRKGYMGHLRLISNLIVEKSACDSSISSYTKREDWQTFVQGELAKLNGINDKRKLASANLHESMQHSDDEDVFEQEFSSMEFRSSEAAVLFDESDELFTEEDKAHQETEDHSLPDSWEETDQDVTSATEGISQLKVNHDSLGAQVPEEPAEPVEDYNDINYWKPSLNWFDPSNG